MAAKIRKGDNVIVLSGRDRGRRGEVIQVMTLSPLRIFAAITAPPGRAR